VSVLLRQAHGFEDTALQRGHERYPLDVGIKQFEEQSSVPTGESGEAAPHDLHVLLRHRPRRITPVGGGVNHENGCRREATGGDCQGRKRSLRSNNERPSRANSPVETLAQPLRRLRCAIFPTGPREARAHRSIPWGRARATQRSLCAAATAPFGAYSDLRRIGPEMSCSDSPTASRASRWSV
jgi:hypothetical protein